MSAMSETEKLALVTGVAGCVGLAILHEIFRPRGRPHLTHRRGAKLLTKEEADTAATAKGNGPFAPPVGFRGLAFGGLWLPFTFAFTGFLWIGAIGVGKTLLFVQFLRSVLELVAERGSQARLFVYDPKRSFGRLVCAALPPHVPVYRLNFLDRRSVWWDLARDFRTPAELHQLASFLIPADKNEIQKYFRDAARALVFAVLLGLSVAAPQSFVLRDVCLICRDKKRMKHFLSLTPEGKDAASTYLDATSAPDVVATLGSCLDKLQIVAACWQHSKTPFSITQFMDEEAVLLLELVDSSSEVQKLLYHLAFRRYSDEVLFRDDPRSLSGALFDELPSLGEIDLTPLTTKGRSAGAVVAASAMSLPALEESLGGPQKAKALLDTLRTRAFLTIDSDETAEYCSKQIGDEEVDEITWPVTDPRGKSQNGRQVNESHAVKPRRLVTADEIKTLPATDFAGGTVAGFFRLPEIGTYRADVRFRDGFPPLAIDPAIPEYDPRPGGEMRLAPFTAADLKRLNIPDNKLTRKVFGVV